MVGRNTLVINQEEMLRALNMYFKELLESNGSCGIDHRGNTRVISVKQVGAQPAKPFVLTLDDCDNKPKSKKLSSLKLGI